MSAPTAVIAAVAPVRMMVRRLSSGVAIRFFWLVGGSVFGGVGWCGCGGRGVCSGVEWVGRVSMRLGIEEGGGGGGGIT